MNPAFRGEAEGDILVSLAGARAGWLAARPEPGYVADEPCEVAAERAARNLVIRSPRHIELLDRTEASPWNGNDEKHAAEMSWALAGKEAEGHLGWMRAVVDRLVPEREWSIGQLGLALLKTPIIAGPAIDEIVLAKRVYALA